MATKVNTILQQFLIFKQAEGKGERTVQDYEAHIKRLFKAYPKMNLNSKELHSNVLEYMAKPTKPAYYNLKLIYLRVFFNYCIQEGYLKKDNPLGNLKCRKTDIKNINISPETIKKLLNLIDKDTFAGIRDYALILLQIDTGIRPGEAIQLLEDDFSFAYNQVTIPAEIAKTRDSRTLPMSMQTTKAIMNVIKYRLIDWPSTTPVFCTVSGETMSINTWELRMKMYSKKLGKKITPYNFRHYFATESLKANPNVHALRIALGHSTLAMATKYLHLVEADIKQWHMTSSPLNAIFPSTGKPRAGKINRKR